MNTLPRNNHIAVTASSEVDLRALEKAFLGNVPQLSPSEVSDDFLVASILGWHMRNTEQRPSRVDGYIFTEFAYRRTIASGANFTDSNSDARTAARGNSSSSGNVLTLDGITDQTLAEIENRIASLLRRFEELEVQASKAVNQEADNLCWQLVAGFSDQEIIDIGTWSMLQTCETHSAADAPFPTDLKLEIERRGANRPRKARNGLV